jgi:hypothetical protein
MNWLVNLACLSGIFAFSSSAYSWTRITWGAEISGGSVEVTSKSAKESSKTGAATSGGVLARFEWLGLPGITVGAGGSMFELSGRNKDKKFKQTYSAGTGYLKAGVAMEAAEDSGIFLGGEYWARFGKGAAFDFEMSHKTVSSAMATLSYRMDDGYGWIPAIDLRAGNDLASGGRKTTFVMAGVSLTR